MSDTKERQLSLEIVGDARAPIELPRQGAMTIGSSRERADVVIEGQGVADVHCAIGRAKGGGWGLKDLGSEHGTIVNGERVQAHKLEAGDLVLVGSRRLRVVDPASKSAEPPRAAPAPTSAPVAPSAPTQFAPQASVPAEAPRGLAVKGYRVERALGRGGMGEVYLAVQESLGRPVALKVLAAKLAADADFVKRFQAEARAAAALNHPNVVTVHDVWEESGRHFLAMEYMDKGNLEQRLQREGRLNPKEAIEILSDAAKALVYAELRGIIHRDIKPANLMQNAVGTTKLADLGLAMHLEAEATESDNKKIFGTPHFISPEQARGEKVDIRSDLYSLGATMYRLISGRTPFEGASTRDILRGHFLEAPKPLAELAPQTPPALAEMVHRLLAKKPDERYASAGVLLQEIERLRSATLHGAPLAPAPASGSKLPLAIGAVVVLALLGGGAFFLGGGSDPKPEDGTKTSGSSTAQTQRPPVDDEPLIPTSNQPKETPRDDDTALKLKEVEAENAYLRIARDSDASVIAADLEALAERFAGTTAATKALEEAAQIRSNAERVAAASGAHAQALANLLERIQLAAGSDSNPLPLAEALRAMLAIEVPEAYAGDSDFVLRRRAAFANVVKRELERARGDAGKADAFEREGRFDDLGNLLRPWIVALDLPPMPSELGFDQIPELGDVVGLRGAIQKRLDGLVSAREKFAKAQSEADLRQLAAGLRGTGGLEGALRSLDFATMLARLDALEAGLATPEAKSKAHGLRDELARSKSALEAVAAEFDRGGWRRKGFNDPRVKGRAPRDAAGVNPQGVLVEAEGAAELIPWTAFGGHPLELHQLFFRRLAREYSADENRGIDSLMRMTAVLHAVDETAEMLQDGSTSVLADDELASIEEAYANARTWAEAAGSVAQFTREHEAMRLWTEALRAGTAGAWSRQVAGLERLMRDYRDTLLVQWLSDGRP